MTTKSTYDADILKLLNRISKLSEAIEAYQDGSHEDLIPYGKRNFSTSLSTPVLLEQAFRDAMDRHLHDRFHAYTDLVRDTGGTIQSHKLVEDFLNAREPDADTQEAVTITQIMVKTAEQDHEEFKSSAAQMIPLVSGAAATTFDDAQLYEAFAPEARHTISIAYDSALKHEGNVIEAQVKLANAILDTSETNLSYVGARIAFTKAGLNSENTQKVDIAARNLRGASDMQHRATSRNFRRTSYSHLRNIKPN